MSWFDRWIWRRPEVRQQMTLEDLVAESGTPTWAGVPVGTDQAMRLSTVWACVRLLADSVSTLPVDVFRRGEREPLQPPPILITPAAGWALHDWLEAVMRSLLLRGNAYGLVVARGANLRPSQVELIHPDAMTVRVNREGMVEYRLHGKPQPAEDIWHVRAFRMPGLVEGLSPIEYARQSIGLGLAVERYGATWFADGGVPPGTFKNTEQTVDQEQADEIKGRLVHAIRTRQPMVHGRDWQFTPVAVKPKESQFIETAKLNVAAIARLFGVPPEMIAGEAGNSLTYASVEMRGIDFLTFGVRPWLVRLETAISALLPRGQFIRFNPGGLLKATTKESYEALEIGIRSGLLTPNEARAKQDLPPLPGGDQLAPSVPPPAKEAA
jgi:HK97 family phage portal protein